jgi:hypothetical protein
VLSLFQQTLVRKRAASTRRPIASAPSPEAPAAPSCKN